MIKKLFVLLLICNTFLVDMTATSNETLTKERFIAKKIGHINAETIVSVDSVVAHLALWENDSLPQKELSPCMFSVVQYILCQPIMYATDKRIYSAFFADVQLFFYKGDTHLVLELDYNINKWRLLDENGNQICRHDLKNSELLTLIHEIWPESKNINIKYKKLTD